MTELYNSPRRVKAMAAITLFLAVLIVIAVAIVAWHGRPIPIRPLEPAKHIAPATPELPPCTTSDCDKGA